MVLLEIFAKALKVCKETLKVHKLTFIYVSAVILHEFVYIVIFMGVIFCGW